MVRRITLTAVLVAVLLAPVALAGGAAEKGSAFVSGQLGVSYFLKGGDPEDSQHSGLGLNFSPRALYFPTKGLGAGLDGNLSLYTNEEYTSTQLAIGPRVAYYLKMNRSRYPHGCCITPFFGMGTYWMPFVGASIMYLTDSYKYQGSTATTASGYRGRLGVGAAPMIGDRGTMFFELGFQTQALKYKGSSSSQSANQIYLEGGFGAFLFDSRN